MALPATGPASAYSRVHRPPNLACSALTRCCVASVCVTPVFSWHCLASGSLADMAKEHVAEGSYIQVSGTYLVRESLQVRGHNRSCRGGGLSSPTVAGMCVSAPPHCAQPCCLTRVFTSHVRGHHRVKQQRRRCVCCLSACAHSDLSHLRPMLLPACLPCLSALLLPESRLGEAAAPACHLCRVTRLL